MGGLAEGLLCGPDTDLLTSFKKRCNNPNRSKTRGKDLFVCDNQLDVITYENYDLGGNDFGPTVGHFFNQIVTGAGLF